VLLRIGVKKENKALSLPRRPPYRRSVRKGGKSGHQRVA